MRIKFSHDQQDVLGWRLAMSDEIRQVFEDTKGLEHLAPDVLVRADEMYRQLNNFLYIDVEHCDLDIEILCEALAGTTWLALFDPANDTRNHAKRFSAAKTRLKNTWLVIARAFNLPEDHIILPEC
ncbi:hypothetical protein [Delftia phage PhiW-14]|uniref:Uncharacterized protein n=1 Tax=Delftia phage PhiW-14 TaxID=665032 RepID=C9DGC5_BPW14|nr:hypothetical protein DP-phiW-14_gp155 [Delftia phage PhiW-14]ACV50176.1 hypothetical protein [Delftia phage PhiW-14]